jgi:hypothetical protein
MDDATKWPAEVMDSWRTFMSHVSDITSGHQQPPSFVFRGQADVNWRLTPALIRLLPDVVSSTLAVAVEGRALREFQAQAHLHYDVSTLPSYASGPDLLDWWALMQHHGAPTRLLDWTHSPYVAAYFAAEQQPRTDGVIYVVHAASAEAASIRSFGLGSQIDDAQLIDPESDPELVFAIPPRLTTRMVTQQGLFSVSVGILGKHDELICRSCSGAGAALGVTSMRRWIIPASLKREFLRQLRIANIAAHSLFPGLDGLGRSVAETVRARRPTAG